MINVQSRRKTKEIILIFNLTFLLKKKLFVLCEMNISAWSIRINASLLLTAGDLRTGLSPHTVKN